MFSQPQVESTHIYTQIMHKLPSKLAIASKKFCWAHQNPHSQVPTQLILVHELEIAYFALGV